MCGIAGAAAPDAQRIDPERLAKMTRAIAHRGPDGHGQWVSPDGRVGLGHRRLSIIDLSDAGAQPMVSASGRFMLSYNGEVYNFEALRRELEALGARFRGHSDTEVMLAGFDAWGIETTLTRMAGMFAIAVHDAADGSLWLARDRVGIKPLYVSTGPDGTLAFASELRAVVAWRGALPPVSARGLTEFLRLGYVPGPLSIFEGVHKLAPGHLAVWRNGTLSTSRPFWRLTDAVAAGRANPIDDPREALAQLEAQLSTAVTSHMVSDVPLGAFLSGGIDSSTVVALMQSASRRPVKTFSIGFHEAAYDEAGHARAVARHLGTEHTELYVSDQDARDVIPQLPAIYDEPFADVSQIPTFLVSRLARQQVTVALSGDGGDELFAGYNRYVFVSRFWRRLRALPAPARGLLARALAAPSQSAWDRFFERAGALMPRGSVPSMPGQKMHKIAATLPARELLSLHGRLVAQWANPDAVLAPAYRGAPMLWEETLARLPQLSDVEQQMLWDAQTYMVDDVLTKVDRASMRVGLEARVPLLDHRVVEFAWRVPLSMKIGPGGQSKWLLRQLLYKHVPQAMVDRPKMGFGVPVGDWLRGSLAPWADELLAHSRVASEGFLDADTLAQTWQQHRAGRVDAGGALWTVLMFQLWWQEARTWV